MRRGTNRIDFEEGSNSLIRFFSGSGSGAQAYVVTAAQNLNPKLTIQSSLTNSSTYSTSQTRYC